MTIDEHNLKVNPLNLFSVRRAPVPPSHYEYADIPMSYNMNDALDKWIETHLKGRYFIGKSVVLNFENKIDYSVRVGFEDSKELSYFMLACPLLKYK